MFARLPSVPTLLRDGEDVHIIVQSSGRDYLYLVTETDLVHEETHLPHTRSDTSLDTPDPGSSGNGWYFGHLDDAAPERR